MARKLERSDARMLYCQEFKEVKEIATILNIPEKTIYRWKKEDGDTGQDWDKDREAFRRTPQARAQELFETTINQFNDLISQMQKEKKIDSQALFAVNKTFQLVEKMMKGQGQHMYPYILTMFKELTDYLGEENEEVLQQLMPYAKPFAEAMGKKYRRN